MKLREIFSVVGNYALRFSKKNIALRIFPLFSFLDDVEKHECIHLYTILRPYTFLNTTEVLITIIQQTSNRY